MPPHVATELDSADVSFDPKEVAAEWEAFNEGDTGGIPASAAATIIAQWFDDSVTPEDGIESDRDVIFPDAEIMVGEKAMGVCDREVAKSHAGAFFDLEREDGRVLALTESAIYTEWSVTPAFCDEHRDPTEEVDTEDAPAAEA